ncbi:hypothetical protein BC829DRAFT_386970 [Chytridium lagenaria]|nr:hypothetical protein BC829DRAFT_386970 [Chytridium lagenaria]
MRIGNWRGTTLDGHDAIRHGVEMLQRKDRSGLPGTMKQERDRNDRKRQEFQRTRTEAGLIRRDEA